MLDVQPHLLQPLWVDTNISYHLDKSKFPGLDDPQQMYQPALLIATDWSDYIYEDTHHVSDEEHDVIDPIEDDLFNLIESCKDLLPDSESSNTMDSASLENFLDGVITGVDMTTSEDSDNVVTSEDILEIRPWVMDTPEKTDLQNEEELSPLPTSVRGQKRRRLSDTETNHSKKFKMADFTPLRLPPLVFVCPKSNICVRHRDS